MTKSQTLLRAIAASMFILTIYVLFITFELALAKGPRLTNDFAVFHIAGQLLINGKTHLLYSFERLGAFETQLMKSPTAFAPWAYPPQQDFIAVAIATLPVAISYLIYVALTYGSWALIARRLAGRHFGLLIILLFPTIITTIMSGQNGFLTASLAGLFAILCLQNRSIAGIPLGLLVIKPQFGIGLAIYVLVCRRWKVAIVAAITIIVTSIAATIAFGVDIWALFLGAARDASHNLVNGLYPFHRMVSLFSSFSSLGVPVNIAMGLQLVGALMAGGLIVYSHLRIKEPRLALGLSIAGAMAFSPYAYDYDLPIFGMGLAFLAPAILAHSKRIELIVLFLLTWVATGTGISAYALEKGADPMAVSHVDHFTPTMAGITYFLALLLVFSIVRRAAPMKASIASTELDAIPV